VLFLPTTFHVVTPKHSRPFIARNHLSGRLAPFVLLFERLKDSRLYARPFASGLGGALFSGIRRSLWFFFSALAWTSAKPYQCPAGFIFVLSSLLDFIALQCIFIVVGKRRGTIPSIRSMVSQNHLEYGFAPVHHFCLRQFITDGLL
jgi:hypothetical protein